MKEEYRKIITPRNIFIGACIIIFLWMLSGFLIHYGAANDRGSFGDMFGAVNALFSGLALFGVIISIMIQQEELSLQRKELSETRTEFKINRLTNVLYKEIESLNNTINNIEFEDYAIDGNKASNKLFKREEFHTRYNTLQYSTVVKFRLKAEQLILKNVFPLHKMISTVYYYIQRYDGIINSYELEKEEVVKLKILYYSNIDHGFHDLTKITVDKHSNFKKEDFKGSKGELEVYVQKMNELADRLDLITNYGLKTESVKDIFKNI